MIWQSLLTAHSVKCLKELKPFKNKKFRIILLYNLYKMNLSTPSNCSQYQQFHGVSPIPSCSRTDPFACP